MFTQRLHFVWLECKLLPPKLLPVIYFWRNLNLAVVNFGNLRYKLMIKLVEELQQLDEKY